VWLLHSRSTQLAGTSSSKPHTFFYSWCVKFESIREWLSVKNTMALVQTSPFLGQIFKEDGAVDVIDNMTGSYSLYDDISNTLIGSAIVKREKCNLHINLPLTSTYLTFEEMEYKSGNLGCKCWLGSFANVIYHNTQQRMLQADNLLELGTGVGICGIAIAKSDPFMKVVITDGFAQLADTINNNIKKNGVASNTSYKKLNWEQINPDIPARSFDIVMGCECVYNDETQDLVSTIVHCLKDNGKAVFINTSHPHRNGVLLFISRLRQHGEVFTRNLSLVYNDEYTAPFTLLEFVKRS